MTQHQLSDWAQYLKADDYKFLIQYVENVKNEIPNDKMIVLAGPERSGKTTLQNDIKFHLNYTGIQLWDEWPVRSAGDVIYNKKIRRLGFFTGIDEIYRSKKSNQAIINFIKYKQSFISDTQYIDKINNILLDHIRIIHMTHVF
jgi:ABC-type phosphate/phosphonate transport system ATPase subunit